MSLEKPKAELPSMLRVLAGERLDPPPIWIMRQAGRYLPEYRQLRARAGAFLDFCYAPAMAAEATLQPLRRFDLNAAIIFSDILTIPDALGRRVRFVESEGPRLDPLIDAPEPWRFDPLPKALDRLGPVYEALERVRAELSTEKALIGFAGAPWTVATYMLQGQGGEKDRARRMVYARPEAVSALLNELVEATAHHLVNQAKAGAQILQIFESWAEGLSPPLFQRLVLAPNAALIDRVRALGCAAPIIGFPRGAGTNLPAFCALPFDGLALDTSVDPKLLPAQRPKALQGNLDPQLLVVGGTALAHGAQEVLAAFADSPHIFNLGHGITPEADPANVAALIALVKGVAK